MHVSGPCCSFPRTPSYRNICFVSHAINLPSQIPLTSPVCQPWLLPSLTSQHHWLSQLPVEVQLLTHKPDSTESVGALVLPGLRGKSLHVVHELWLSLLLSKGTSWQNHKTWTNFDICNQGPNWLKGPNWPNWLSFPTRDVPMLMALLACLQVSSS